MIKITGGIKDRYGPGLGCSPLNLGFPFDICTMAESSDFKFGRQLGFAKNHQKSTPRGKVGVALG